VAVRTYGVARARRFTIACTNTLLAVLPGGSYPVVVAAVLPCYGCTRRIGDELYARPALTGTYHRWIGAYADPGFRRPPSACLLADQPPMAPTAPPATPVDCSRRSERSSMHEYLLFTRAHQPRWLHTPGAPA